MNNRIISLLSALTAIALAMAARGAFAAVGVRLNLVEPIVVTNIPAAYNAGFNAPTNGCWSFDQIVDIATNTSGLECYFINSFIDEKRVRAGNSSHGIVMTAMSDCTTLAHEIGHAFNMSDIYVTNKNEEGVGSEVLTVSGYVSMKSLPKDWNGGCDWKGMGGTRYYQAGRSQSDIIRRLVMFGHHRASDSRRDFSAGKVKGVYYEDEVGVEWFLDLADVGFFTSQRNAQHQ